MVKPLKQIYFKHNRIQYLIQQYWRKLYNFKSKFSIDQEKQIKAEKIDRNGI